MNSPSLADSRRARFGMFFLLYFCQGIPLGLAMVAIPAWLAQGGVSTAKIAGVTSAAFLPWGIKMFNGLIMERYAYLPMGRRRGWLLGAQLLIFISLAAFIVLTPRQDQLILITALLFAMNVGATFQDAAIDGIAVDVTPEAERGRVNSFMAGGQILGISGSGAAAGYLLTRYGLQGAVLPGLCVIGVSLIAVSLVLERAGEKALPWTKGTAAQHVSDDIGMRWWPLLRRVFGAMKDKRIAALLTAMTSYGAFAGILTLAAPVYGVKALGWTAEQASNLLSLSGLAAGVIGLVFFGLAIDRLGTRRVGTATFLFLVLLWAAFALAAPNSSNVFTGAIAASYVILQALFIAMCAVAMRFCRADVAASQFALLMALPNLSRAATTNLVDPLVKSGGYDYVWMALAIIPVIGLGAWALAERNWPLTAKNARPAMIDS